MSKQTYRIVSGDDSDIHGEPHVEGSRVTVRYVYRRVEEAGDSPERVAEQHDLRLSDVYEALAYYHSNPEEMRRAETRHRKAVEEAKRRSSLEPTES